MEPSLEERKEAEEGCDHKPKRIITSQMVRYYQWSEDMTQRARETIETAAKQDVNASMYSKLEREAKKNWDLFYKANKTNFYKDRHYIKYEF
jgi:methyltransferase-like protein 6